MITDEEYDAIQSKIAELQNDDYASTQAAQLQTWLGNQVLKDYLESIGVIEGTVIDTFWMDE